MATSDFIGLHAEEADRQGWQLVEVWVPESSKIVLEAHPIEFKKPYDSMTKVYQWLWNKAKSNDKTALAGLQAISNYQQKKAKKK